MPDRSRLDGTELDRTGADGLRPDDVARGRLRRRRSATGPALPGHHAVVVDGERLGLSYVPPTRVDWLVVLLHGAGGTAEDALRLLLRQADERGLMLYAPKSVGPTWDVIAGGYGPDVRRLQLALAELAAPRNVALGGFSDGASYALSLGLTNGDVFDALLAFSPGFAAPGRAVGDPDVFVSHGRSDRVLPIDRCSRRLVPGLQRAGYRVHYHEFDGGHVVPVAAVDEALDRLPGIAAGAGGDR